MREVTGARGTGTACEQKTAVDVPPQEALLRGWDQVGYEYSRSRVTAFMTHACSLMPDPNTYDYVSPLCRPSAAPFPAVAVRHLAQECPHMRLQGEQLRLGLGLRRRKQDN